MNKDRTDFDRLLLEARNSPEGIEPLWEWIEEYGRQKHKEGRMEFVDVLIEMDFANTHGKLCQIKCLEETLKKCSGGGSWRRMIVQKINQLKK